MSVTWSQLIATLLDEQNRAGYRARANLLNRLKAVAQKEENINEIVEGDIPKKLILKPMPSDASRVKSTFSRNREKTPLFADLTLYAVDLNDQIRTQCQKLNIEIPEYAKSVMAFIRIVPKPEPKPETETETPESEK